jgi:hypothetical protein
MEARSTTCKAVRAIWCASIAKNTARHAQHRLGLLTRAGALLVLCWAQLVMLRNSDAASMELQDARTCVQAE